MTTRRTTARTATTIEERIAEATRTAIAAIAATAATTATATPTTFGIELEMTGISRKAVSELVYNYLQSKEEIEIYCRDTFKIIDQQGRKWSVDYDGSIHGDSKEQVELVTPILTMEDLPLLKGLIETLKAAGAKSSDKLGCGLHIHVGSHGHTAKSIRNLVNIMAAHEDQLFKAFEVTARDRVGHYCKKVNENFLKKLNEQKPATLDKLADLWYKSQGYDFMRDDKYNGSRYHALNLHALFNPLGYTTIEFRFGQFTEETSMDWTVLEAFIRICLAINDLAKSVKTASFKKQQDDNPAYAFRCWLLRLGFIGEETKAARKFLLKNFSGDKAWRKAA